MELTKQEQYELDTLKRELGNFTQNDVDDQLARAERAMREYRRTGEGVRWKLQRTIDDFERLKTLMKKSKTT